MPPWKRQTPMLVITAVVATSCSGSGDQLLVRVQVQVAETLEKFALAVDKMLSQSKGAVTTTVA